MAGSEPSLTVLTLFYYFINNVHSAYFILFTYTTMQCFSTFIILFWVEGIIAADSDKKLF